MQARIGRKHNAARRRRKAAIEKKLGYYYLDSTLTFWKSATYCLSNITFMILLF